MRTAFRVLVGLALTIALMHCGSPDCPPGAHPSSVFCHLHGDSSPDATLDGSAEASSDARPDRPPMDMGTDVPSVDMGTDVPTVDMGTDVFEPCTDAGAGTTCAEGLRCALSGHCTCGNGVLDPGEQCDDGTDAPGSGCEPGCTFTCSPSRACPATPASMQCAGPTSCDDATHRCVRVSPAAAGSPCGPMGEVCDGLGICMTCAMSGTRCTPPGTTCHTGAISCATGAPVCTDTGMAPAGTSCGMDRVCSSSGACVACVEGAMCDPGIGCHNGINHCATGTPVCTDSGAVPPGTSCGAGMVCSPMGTCIACADGAACNVGVPCHSGVIRCTTGAAVCNDSGPVAAGTPCGSGMVCSLTGICAPCSDGMSCDPGIACHTGTQHCASGMPQCASSGLVPAGTSCGVGMVCSAAGACVACIAGTPCDPGIACHGGAIQCGSGTAACADTGPLAAGTSCGAGRVCNPTGTCIACVDGMSCAGVPACHTGMLRCATGAPVCTDSGTLPPGTSCGANMVCSSTGTCVACVDGMACNPGIACHNGVLRCGSGAPVCMDAGAVAAGTNCGANMVCSPSGTCIACSAGMACSVGNPCTSGVIGCSTGAPVCGSITNLPPGSLCPGGVCDGSGRCTPCVAGMACSTGNACTTGAIACGSGAPVCQVSGNVAGGTPCGGAQMACNGAGMCVCVPNCSAGHNCGPDGCGGSCGTCSGGQVCNGTACACPAGLTLCNGTCVDVTSDPANCGVCGTACGVPNSCSNGACGVCSLGTSRACYDGPAGTNGVGVCHAGTQSCVAGGAGSVYTACAGEQTPVGETCNNLVDDNCNGAVDEGCCVTTSHFWNCVDTLGSHPFTVTAPVFEGTLPLTSTVLNAVIDDWGTIGAFLCPAQAGVCRYNGPPVVAGNGPRTLPGDDENTMVGGCSGSASIQWCVCTPNCAGHNCGSDGCGGTCGTCPSGQVCTAGTCGVCTPSCVGRTCGTDGCGGSCGTCGVGMRCLAGNCSCISRLSCPCGDGTCDPTCC